MSWFSLAVSGRSAWDSHSFVNSVLTGTLPGNFIFRRFISSNSKYHQAAQTVSSKIAESGASRVSERYIYDIAQHILERTIVKEKMLHMISRIRHHSQGFSSNTKLAIGKSVAAAVKKQVTNYWQKQPAVKSQNYRLEEKQALKELAKRFQFNELARQMVIVSLRPSFEEMVKKGLKSVMKNSIKTAIDFSVRRTLSLALVPIIYQLFSETVQWTAGYFDSDVDHMMGFTAEHLPSTAQIFWASAIYNIAETAFSFWRTTQIKQERNDRDKQDVKLFALSKLKKSLAEKLQQNELLKTIELTPKNIEELAEALICETVDLYWADLSQSKFIGLPLVA